MQGTSSPQTDMAPLPKNLIKAFARRFAFPEWKIYLLGILALAATNVVSLTIPQLAKLVVNNIDSLATDQLKRYALQIAMLGTLMIIIRTLSRVLIFWPARKIETESKSFLFRKLIMLPQSYFDSHGMGDIISRIANDVTHIRIFFGFGALQLFNLIFLSVFTISQMASTHLGLTIASLSPLVLMVVVLRYTQPRMHLYSKKNQEDLGQLTNRATEAFVNAPIVKANGAEAAFLQRISVENEKVYQSNINLLFLRQVVFPLMALLSGLSQVVVLFYGGWEVVNQNLTVGDIMAFNVYISYLAFPLSAIGIVISVYQRALTALQRVGEIDQAKIENAALVHISDASQSAWHLPTYSSSADAKVSDHPILKISNLQFRYPQMSTGHSPFGLTNISFEVPKGGRIGICGPIGSGKSSVLNLIAHIYTPPTSTIWLDQQDTNILTTERLRSLVGYAPQTVHLFSDTIRNNLCFGASPTPTDAEIESALRRAEMWHDVLSFPQGLETQVGERGVRLSGGQKQRLALARLFLRRVPILILDDVLSAVDQETEHKLANNIFESGVSYLVASHRASVLQSCEQILIMDNGAIKARGTFNELKTQFKDLLSGMST